MLSFTEMMITQIPNEHAASLDYVFTPS